MAPIDLTKLEEIAGDDPEFIQEILDTFVQSTDELMGPLRDGVRAGDIVVVQRESHRLKGSSANVGAEGLRECSVELEQLGRSGSLDGAAAILEQIEAEFVRVRSFLAERQRN